MVSLHSSLTTCRIPPIKRRVLQVWGGGLDLVCRPKRFFLSTRSGVKAQCKVYMFENSKLIFADMFKFLRHECCEMHIVSPATPSGSVL